MKILILNTTERNGGAALAANRLMHALSENGQDIKMLVRNKQTNDENVVSINRNWWRKKINFVRFIYERWVIFLCNNFNKKNLFAISIANTGTNISRHPLVKKADIIHLHWINQGFLSLNDIRKLIKLGKPIVWTMHDMWCYTGICHYSGDCQKYKTKCENCPILKKNITDKTKQTFAKKRRVLSSPVINFVGCSQWIANKARESVLLRNLAITSVPNAINTEVFSPANKIYARQKFELPIDKKLILFVAAKLSDTRKGMSYFVEACQYLTTHKREKSIEIVFIGKKIDENLLSVITLKTHLIGYLKTPVDISTIYAACDVFVIPSLEDNLPNTIMESMSCGTPCVGFNIGGIPEMIDHKQNGYVAEYKSPEDLAAGIEWVLENKESLNLSKACVEKVQNTYAEKIVAKQYIELYNRLLEEKTSN
jgi:glycosyltransferase involved in cell wall biosynthesis